MVPMQFSHLFNIDPISLKHCTLWARSHPKLEGLGRRFPKLKKLWLTARILWIYLSINSQLRISGTALRKCDHWSYPGFWCDWSSVDRMCCRNKCSEKKWCPFRRLISKLLLVSPLLVSERPSWPLPPHSFLAHRLAAFAGRFWSIEMIRSRSMPCSLSAPACHVFFLRPSTSSRDVR